MKELGKKEETIKTHCICNLDSRKSTNYNYTFFSFFLFFILRQQIIHCAPSYDTIFLSLFFSQTSNSEVNHTNKFSPSTYDLKRLISRLKNNFEFLAYSQVDNICLTTSDIGNVTVLLLFWKMDGSLKMLVRRIYFPITNIIW